MADRIHSGSSANTLVEHISTDMPMSRMMSPSTTGSNTEADRSNIDVDTNIQSPASCSNRPTITPHARSGRKTMDSEKTLRPNQMEDGQTDKTDLEYNTGTLPWHRRDGWSGWGRENVSTIALVPSLVCQAFSAGVLDAITYAEFSTFASNRKSSFGL